MKKIIVGSIVCIILASAPTQGMIEIFASELMRNNDRVAIVKKVEESKPDEESENANIREAIDVDNVVASLDKNSRKIKQLIREKNSVIGKVQAVLDLKAHAKSKLSDFQITQFQEFTSCYQRESEIVNEMLDNISSNNLLSVKNEILDSDSDFQYIYDELKVINDYQSGAIFSLNSIIDTGLRTLQVL